MAVTQTPIFPQALAASAAAIIPATGTGTVTLVTAGANGTRINSLILTSTDSAAAYSVQAFVNISATAYLLGTVNVPLSSGNTSAVPSVDFMRSAQNPGLPLDSMGNPYIDLPSGATLTIASLTTVTTAKAINAIATGGNF